MATTISSAVADAAVHAVAPSASPAARHGALSILNKIGSFPSRFIARMQLIDELLEQDAERQAAALAAALNDPENSQAQRLRPSGLHVAGVTPMPGPWGFFASWYAVGLFIMVRETMIYVAARTELVIRRLSLSTAFRISWFRRDIFVSAVLRRNAGHGRGRSSFSPWTFPRRDIGHSCAFLLCTFSSRIFCCGPLYSCKRLASTLHGSPLEV